MTEIVAFSTNFLAYPVICGSLIHNGLIMLLSLYLINYLSEFLLLYGSISLKNFPKDFPCLIIGMAEHAFI